MSPSASPWPSPGLDDYAGWATYANTGYGFSFHYPPNWSVQEIPSDGTRPSVIRVRWEMLRLVIQYKRVVEDIPVEEYAPAGIRETRGAVDFLGQSLSREVVVEDGKVKGVVYQAPERLVQAGHLVFDVSLRSVAADECLQEFERECYYQAIDIPAALQAEVDRIVASFRLIQASSSDAYPGWARYTRADYGFSFRYPPAWVLREGENFVSLRQETLRLILGYREVSEETNVYFEREWPVGDIAPAGTVRFLEQDIPRTLLEHEGKVKAVYYNNAERICVADRMFLIALEDFSVDYSSVDIPEALQAEVNQIVASFVTLQPIPDLMMPTPVATRLPPTPLPATPVPATAVAGSDGANVRSGPGTNYTHLGYLDPGGQVAVIGRYSDWWQIVYGNAPAWVAARVVSVYEAENVPEVELTPPPGLTGPRVVAGLDGANVRNGPGTGFALVGRLSPGIQAPVTGRYGDWWQVNYEGREAWIADWVIAAYDVEGVPEAATPPTPIPSSPEVIPPPTSVTDIHEPRWIDVDLTNQRITAYEGQSSVYSTLASTGLPSTPTPTGQFRIWIKLRYDDMSGPGYYLKDVPFVMYFYKGYGFHGVWWHANFGHQMSHGCINLPNDAAEWLFNWADVGTLVNIHD